MQNTNRVDVRPCRNERLNTSVEVIRTSFQTRDFLLRVRLKKQTVRSFKNENQFTTDSELRILRMKPRYH
jgi:hypothetical protein